jgi:hypothetical protein
MYLGFYSFFKHYNRNRMLNDPTGPIGDEIRHGFYFAGKRLRELGHRVATLDRDELEKLDCALFFDHPTFLDPYYRKLRRMPGKKLQLSLFEMPPTGRMSIGPGTCAISTRFLPEIRNGLTTRNSSSFGIRYGCRRHSESSNVIWRQVVQAANVPKTGSNSTG